MGGPKWVRIIPRWLTNLQSLLQNKLVFLRSSPPTSPPPRWISTASPPPPRWQLLFSTVGVLFSRDASYNQHCCCSQRHGQQRTSVGRDAISGCSLAGHAPVDFQTGRAGGHVSRCQISHCSNQRNCQSATLPFPSVIVPLAIRVSESSGEADSLL